MTVKMRHASIPIWITPGAPPMVYRHVATLLRDLAEKMWEAEDILKKGLMEHPTHMHLESPHNEVHAANVFGIYKGELLDYSDLLMGKWLRMLEEDCSRSVIFEDMADFLENERARREQEANR